MMHDTSYYMTAFEEEDVVQLFKALQEVEAKDDGFGGEIFKLPAGVLFPCERETSTLANTLIVRQADEDILSVINDLLADKTKCAAVILIIGPAGAGKVIYSLSSYILYLLN